MHHYAIFSPPLSSTLTTQSPCWKTFKSSFFIVHLILYISTSRSPQCDALRLIDWNDKIALSLRRIRIRERVMWWGLRDNLTLTRWTSRAVFPPESTIFSLYILILSLWNISNQAAQPSVLTPWQQGAVVSAEAILSSEEKNTNNHKKTTKPRWRCKRQHLNCPWLSKSKNIPPWR